MKALSAKEIKGNWVPIMLPINPDDSIDYARLADQMDYLVSLEIDGIYSNGTAAEFYAQSEAEFDRISEMLAGRCERAQMPFQIGASHMSAQISLERIKRAATLQPSAIQVILPDWQALSDEEVIICLQKYAEIAAPINLVLYNPPQSKRVLLPQDYARLKNEVPQLVGIKVAGGDDSWYQAMQVYAAHLSIFVPGHHLASGICRGASGAYSNVACIHPLGAQHWYDLMQSDMEQALDIEKRIRDFMDQYIVPLMRDEKYINQAVDKLLCEIGGWTDLGTRLRFPYRWVDPARAEPLKAIIRQQVPELFESNSI